MALRNWIVLSSLGLPSIVSVRALLIIEWIGKQISFWNAEGGLSMANMSTGMTKIQDQTLQIYINDNDVFGQLNLGKFTWTNWVRTFLISSSRMNSPFSWMNFRSQRSLIPTKFFRPKDGLSAVRVHPLSTKQSLRVKWSLLTRVKEKSTVHVIPSDKFFILR